MPHDSINIEDLLIDVQVTSNRLRSLAEERKDLLVGLFKNTIPELAKEIEIKGLPMSIVISENLLPFKPAFEKFVMRNVIVMDEIEDSKFLLFWMPIELIHEN